ncbi:MAG: hypothetical protein LBE13_08240 [Bacteroidales bacterium]|jgi:hypothetical protein|nr:hypothetical protein [Bacteroidales bacterium]
MQNILFKFTPSFLIQIFLFLFVNTLFILKYVSRIEEEGVNALIILFIYILLFLSFLYLYIAKIKWMEEFYKIAFWSILVFLSVVIIALLISVDPYSVNVDRWSAVTFFLDGLFSGNYPYAVHTHMSETNFPSPFPVWYIINFPFYCLGDVGIGLIFFLWLTAFCVRYFFNSYEKSFLFLFFLFISPAYWWEIVVRSDSLSNALLVFCFILWFSKKEYALSDKLGLTILICGLLLTTRLSAILPVALFLFKPWLKLSWKQKIIFPLAIITTVFLAFSPFIFWDTNTWIFFYRNPFISETSAGSPYVLILMIIIGCFWAYRWQGITQFFDSTAIFTFLFMLVSQINLIMTKDINGSIFTDLVYDISYFSLLLPYCFAFLSEKLHNFRSSTC